MKLMNFFQRNPLDDYDVGGCCRADNISDIARHILSVIKSLRNLGAGGVPTIITGTSIERNHFSQMKEIIIEEEGKKILVDYSKLQSFGDETKFLTDGCVGGILTFYQLNLKFNAMDVDKINCLLTVNNVNSDFVHLHLGHLKARIKLFSLKNPKPSL